MNNPLSAVVLGFGVTRRSQSPWPNPMLRICGQPMIRYVLDALTLTDADQVVVVTSRDAQAVAGELAHIKPIDKIIEHDHPRGSADAVLGAITAIGDDFDDDVLVISGDAALIDGDSLRALVAHHRESGSAITLLTADEPQPAGLPRIIRSARADSIVGVIEDDDLVASERPITEVFTGILCARRSLLAPALRRVRPDNLAGELYLSGVVEVLAQAGHQVEGFASSPDNVLTINSNTQLAVVEQVVRARINRDWMARGVTITDPSHTYIDATVQLGSAVVLLPGTMLQGETVIGEGAEIGPNTRLVDSVVGARSTVETTTARGAAIGADCTVGPYVHLGPGAKVAAATTLSPFYTSEPNES